MIQYSETYNEIYFVYILFSKSIQKYYVGSTPNIPERLREHNHPNVFKNWTEAGSPWILVYSIGCNSKGLALKIERHIKKNKSSVYIGNLIKYPEISAKLKQKYS